MFIGQIVGIVSDGEVLTPDQLHDIEKVRPLLFGSFGNMAHYSIGENIGKAFSLDQKLKKI